MSDERREPRARALLEVAVEEGGRQIFAPALDVSAGGLLLGAEDPPKQGARVRLVLSVPPSGIFLRLHGTVVRHDPDRRAFAVAFDAVDEQSVQALRDFVATIRVPRSA